LRIIMLFLLSGWVILSNKGKLKKGCKMRLTLNNVEDVYKSKIGKYKLRKLENNTYEYNDNEGLKVRLHDTDILSFVGDNVTLSTGGYYTNTTKARLNKYLPMGFSIYQKDFQWYIKAYDKTITFKDNITLDINTGLVIG